MDKYDFEAPKFVNFMEKNSNTPDVDKWFGKSYFIMQDARDGTPESLQPKDTVAQNGPVVKDLTIPQPFKFHSTAKKVSQPVGSPFVPLALRVKAFETNTPERFKKKVNITILNSSLAKF